MLVSIRDLRLDIRTAREPVHILRGIDLDIPEGHSIGLVGESGSGKTMTARTVIQLLPESARTDGQIMYREENLLERRERDFRRIRGREIGIIFQTASAALNPVLTIGRQLGDVHVQHRGGTRGEARQVALDMLRRVGFPDPAERIDCYVHELSGGMAQRVIVAMALMSSPRLLIADEPTTGLDVTIQKQVLDLIVNITREMGSSLLFISHDIDLVVQACDAVAVMYAGRIVETAGTQTLLTTPCHPYTCGLLNSFEETADHRLTFIEGAPPSLHQEIAGCSFAPRCRRADRACESEDPRLLEAGPGHLVACHHPMLNSGRE